MIMSSARAEMCCPPGVCFLRWFDSLFLLLAGSCASAYPLFCVSWPLLALAGLLLWLLRAPVLTTITERTFCLLFGSRSYDIRPYACTPDWCGYWLAVLGMRGVSAPNTQKQTNHHVIKALSFVRKFGVCRLGNRIGIKHRLRMFSVKTGRPRASPLTSANAL